MLKNIFFIMTLIFIGICHSQQITWSSPYDLSASGEDNKQAKLMVNENGTAVAIWIRSDGTHDRIQESHSSNGGATWSTPKFISDAGQNADSPALAINNNVVIAVWTRYNSTHYIIQEKHSTNGGIGWSTAQDLSLSGQNASAPDIALNDIGKSVVVWTRYDGSDWVIQERHSADGGASWPNPPTQRSTGGQDSYIPKVAMNNSDETIVIWQRSDSTHNLIRECYSPNAGTNWIGPQVLSTPGQNAAEAQVIINNNGVGIVVWKRNNGLYDVVQSIRSPDAGASWVALTDLSISTQDSYFPEIALNDNNNAVAIWTTYNGANYILKRKYSTDGGATWSAVYDLTPLGQSAQKYPQIVMNNNDVVVPFWALNNGTNFIAQAAVSFDGGISWAPTQDLSAPGQNTQSHQITMNNNRRDIIGIWRRSNGTNDIIQEVHVITLSVSGNQFSKRSLFQNQIVNELLWDAEPAAIFYRVYANVALTDLIYEGTDLYHYDGVKKGQIKTYYIVWVDGSGNESSPAVVNIP